MNDPLQEMLQANTRFYKAFEEMDFSAMSMVWSKRPEDCCIHPGWEILIGWRQIRESWRVIFANTNFMRIELTELSTDLPSPTIGRVCCIENLFTVIDNQTIHSQVACTNLFQHGDDGWKLIHHQGSPIASQPVMVQDLDLN